MDAYFEGQYNPDFAGIKAWNSVPDTIIHLRLHRRDTRWRRIYEETCSATFSSWSVLENAEWHETEIEGNTAEHPCSTAIQVLLLSLIVIARLDVTTSAKYTIVSYRNVMQDLTRLLYLLNKNPSKVQVPPDGAQLLSWSEQILERYLQTQVGVVIWNKFEWKVTSMLYMHNYLLSHTVVGPCNTTTAHKAKCLRGPSGNQLLINDYCTINTV